MPIVTPALDAFVTHLEKRGLSLELLFASDPPARIAIPAKDTATGGIVIFDETHELTVELEGKHHSHFTTPQAAADFVADIVTQRVCVAVDYMGGRCIGSSYFQLDEEGVTVDTLRDSLVGLKGGSIRSERFLWSGPVDTSRK